MIAKSGCAALILVAWGRLTAQTCPALAAPELEFLGSHKTANGLVEYRLAIKNAAAFSAELFEAAPDLPPCGLNKNASRGWLDIYDSDGRRIYGYCAMRSADDLKAFGFNLPLSDPPAKSIYVSLTDRRCKTASKSETVVIASERSLTGRWRSVQTSKGGIGAMFEFHEDGTLSYSPGAIVESKYTAGKKHLTVTFTDRASGKVDEHVTAIVTLNDKELALSPDLTSPLMKYTRVGSPPDPGDLILGDWAGTWAGAKNAASPSLLQFNRDGTELLTIQFYAAKGSYTVEGDTVRMQIQGQPPLTGKFDWDGEILVLPGPHGTGESRFKRY